MGEMRELDEQKGASRANLFDEVAPELPPPTLLDRVCGCFAPSVFIDTMVEPRVLAANSPETNASSLHYFPTNYVTTSKYTLLSFLPKNLYEQFQKAANFYFLLIAIVVSIPGVSTIEPYTSIMPLIFVLSVTATKEAYEDYHRHLSDNETNNSLVDVVTPSGAVVEKVWSDLAVGDICQVFDGQALPADIILISSSEEDGSASVMTANLDGETNLKTKRCLKATQHLNTAAKLAAMKARARCEPPSADLNSFEGLWLDESTGEQFPLNNEQLLLRGSKLMDTEYAFGFVAYTGIQTKLVLNSNNPRHKRSKVEREMNKQMIYIFVMQFFLVLVCAVVSAVWYADDIQNHFYLDDDPSTGQAAKIGARNFAAFYILFSVMVPISLYVSMELVKVAQSLIIWWDIQMYDPISDTRALARTSNLNEELGQIKYIFSDKTGTLTQNKMSFYKCAVNGVSYGEDVVDVPPEDEREVAAFITRTATHRGKLSHVSEAAMEDKMGTFSKFKDDRFVRMMQGKNGDGIGAEARVAQDFLTCLAVCHTVDTCEGHKKDKDAGIEYKGVSVDEIALAIAAQDFGFSFLGRERNEVRISTPWEKSCLYDVKQVLDFTSERKRMSVICRTPEGKLRLYIKGADSVMMEMLGPGNDPKVVQKTLDHLEDFSAEGLRTLVIGYVDLDQSVYDDWAVRYVAASEAIGDRKSKLEALAGEIEKDIKLLGVTAIEDALQVGVVETLQKLRRASIKVWMLTGDKQGTAVNIGKSCGLIDSKLHIKYIRSLSKDDMVAELTRLAAYLDSRAAGEPASRSSTSEHGDRAAIHNAGSSSQFNLDQKEADSGDASKAGISQAEEERDTGVALVIDGPCLAFAMLPEAQDLFFRVINHSESRVVICSRMAPRQKAEIVELVKANLDVVTLAVGDGANDVSMIQAAHVGVGIRGKEGLQAVNTSDYAIAQFRFLARLLLVHGRLSYKRNTKLILYSFYKGIMLSFTQFFFSCFSVFSGQEIYDGILLNTFNLFFASLPILGVATLDRDLEPLELLHYPEIYREGIRGSGFNNRVYWSWVFTSIYHAAIVFFIPWFSLQQYGLWTQSMATYSCLVIAANFKLASMTNTWTGWNHFFTWGSIAFWFLFAYGVSSTAGLDYFPNLFGTFDVLASDSSYWICLIFVAWMSIMQDYIYSFWRFAVGPPSLKLNIQVNRKLGLGLTERKIRSLSSTL